MFCREVRVGTWLPSLIGGWDLKAYPGEPDVCSNKGSKDREFGGEF